MPPHASRPLLGCCICACDNQLHCLHVTTEYGLPSLPPPPPQGMIELLFTVYDLDGSVTVDTQSDLVDTILITPMISAVPSQDDPFTEAMTFSGNFSELDLSFRLTCGEDFYGPDCTVFCVDTNDTSSGHYTCDRSTGEKVCLEGYRNSDTNCTECAPRQSCSECL